MSSKMFKVAFIGFIALPSVISFPGMAGLRGMPFDDEDAYSDLTKRQTAPGCYDLSCCPNNPNHVDAAPFIEPFLYLGANNGLPATRLGNIEVPTDNDDAHAFEAPGPLDIRGPCPGLNTMANHHFIAHDGITNLTEVLNAQQNLWNVGYDLALVLALIAINLSGDPVTTRFSIGCDATPRTSIPIIVSILGNNLLGEELGIDAHNKFEADTSLSRSDYYFNAPDNFTFNKTLFAMMTQTTGANYNLSNMVKYMGQRYDQSKATNPTFYFGPKIVLLYGAASFLFRLFPNFVSGDTAPPNLQNIGPFFGAVQNNNTDDTNRTFVFSGGERFPDEWHNRRTPLTLYNVAQDFVTMYGMSPKLLGGNVGVNNFDGLNTFQQAGVSGVTNSMFTGATAQDIACLFYQAATENLPTSVTSGSKSLLPLAALALVETYLNPLPIFKLCNLVNG